VDGSGWEAVFGILRRDGFTVGVVQNPTISLAGDVDSTRPVIAAQDGPVILVGHSYGGAVITEAAQRSQCCRSGLHRRLRSGPGRVGGYPHQGSASGGAGSAHPAAHGRLSPPRQGKFAGSFVADIDPELAAFMADAQLPWGSKRSAERLASPPGGPSRRGTWSPPKTA
jgi:pimeloyl-ACP methyl ester carboxylesterase